MRAWAETGSVSAVREQVITPLVAIECPVDPRRNAGNFRRVACAKASVALADALALALLAMVVAYEVGGISTLTGAPHAGEYVLVCLVVLRLWLLVFARYGLYTTRRVVGRLQESRAVFHAVAVGSAVLAISAYMFQTDVARRWVVLTFVFGLAFVLLERDGSRRFFAALRSSGRFLRRVVVVGANDEGQAIAAMLGAMPSLGYRVVGFVDDTRTSNGISVLGTVADTVAVANAEGATGAIIATTALDTESCNVLARQLVDAGLHVELSSSLRDISSDRLIVRPLGHFPVVYLQPVRRKGWRAVAKRAFDLAAASFALVLLSPVIAAVAIAVKVDSKGPIFFRQRRGRLATASCSRSGSSERWSPTPSSAWASCRSTTKRMVRSSRCVTIRESRASAEYLRRVSLDEIPQFWNVCRGEMSLVGPRPALPREAATWTPCLSQRLRVKPGLTGMWQVNGRSDAEVGAYERLDLYYVDNWSLVTDLAIVARTLPTLLRRDGAY